MRRKDREMDEIFALGIADKCEYAVLSMTDTGGAPYCVPISIARDGRDIFFHCAREGKKIDAMRRAPEVCIACVGDTRPAVDKFTTEFESAIIRGRAEEILEDTQKIHALRLLCQRHTPANMHNFDAAARKSLARTAVWRVPIREITGKRKKYDSQGKEMKFGRTE